MRVRAAHGHVRRDRARLEVDGRNRSVVLIRHVRGLAVARDGDGEGVAADRHEPRLARRQVHDRHLVGLVERRDERAPVWRHRQSLRPPELRARRRAHGGVVRTDVRLRGAAARGRELDRTRLGRPTALRVDREQVDCVAARGGHRPRRMARADRLAGHVRRAPARCEGDAPVRARQRQRLDHGAAAYVHDLHVVAPVARVDRPVKAPVWRQRATAREVPDRGHPPCGMQGAYRRAVSRRAGHAAKLAASGAQALRTVRPPTSGRGRRTSRRPP